MFIDDQFVGKLHYYTLNLILTQVTANHPCATVGPDSQTTALQLQ